MSLKKSNEVAPVISTDKTTSPTAPWAVSGKPLKLLATATRAEAPAAEDLLLVCVQDPFDAVGDSSTIVHSKVPAADGNLAHQWKLECVMSMNPPRCFKSWATRSSFTLDFSVHASVSPDGGTWGGRIETTSGSGKCRVIAIRGSNNKVRFSLVAGTQHAPELSMPSPDQQRYLNADIAFELNGTSGLNVGAVGVISNKHWSHLIAASNVPNVGMAFDGKWRQKLEDDDGDSSCTGVWAFEIMTREDYEDFCQDREWTPYILADP